ncbi:MAG: response regulator transcription factor [Leptospiraceae bacterium]|nr:response regulator transcription factor [Leptospiraceae bacterium]
MPEFVQNLDLIFVDIHLADCCGMEILYEIRLHLSKLPVVMLTNVCSEEVILRSIQLGASGYIFKPELQSMQNALIDVMNGGAVLSPGVAHKILYSIRDQQGTTKHSNLNAKLTSREIQILEQYTTGRSKIQIADVLKISEETVRSHVKNIYKKLEVNNKLALLRLCQEQGLLSAS